MKKSLLISLLICFAYANAQEVIQNKNGNYLSNTLIIKLKENAEPNFSFEDLFPASPKNLNKTTLLNAQKMFPEEISYLKKGNSVLSNIYLATFLTGEDPKVLAEKISLNTNIEYAEPKYIHQIAYEPNDFYFTSGLQKHLTRIKAQQAWDISKGDSSVIIAIIDTGVDWNHPDLVANILRDANGKMIGKDFGGLSGTPDDDPSEDYNSAYPLAFHGTHVAGIAAAVSDNQIGVASIGFNCSIMPVKVSRSDMRDNNGYSYVYYGFEGIKYAADNGAKIINCSWGSYSYSRFEQELINYATSKGSLVVAAAGNDNSNSLFYPASYKNVLSVGWLNTDTDSRSPNGNYGAEIDVMAPGNFITSTWNRVSGNETEYRAISGSSMSAPQVSGLAGLIASKFISYSPLQIAERIRMTADLVDSNNPDSTKYLLGKGRINAYSALSTEILYSIRPTVFRFVEIGNGNGLFESGESVEAFINFQNYFNTVQNLTVSVESTSNAVSIKKFIEQPIGFNEGGVAENVLLFSFDIHPEAVQNSNVNFLVKLSGTGYSDYFWCAVKINPPYRIHNNNKIELTVSSNGTIAYNDFPENLEGTGFKFEGKDNVMFEGAFMYGNSSATVMDAAREIDTQSKDFQTIQPIKISSYPELRLQQGITIFNDSKALSNSLGISTRLISYSYNEPNHQNYIILRSIMENQSEKDINGLYAGYYIDWDVPFYDSGDDTTGNISTDKIAFAFDKDRKEDNSYYGAKLLSEYSFNYYPILNDQNIGEISLLDGFDDSEKFITLSSGVKVTNKNSGDVAFVISGGSFNLPAKSSREIAFGFGAGTSLNELKNVLNNSLNKYGTLLNLNTLEEIPNEFFLEQNYPNPFNPETTIRYRIPISGKVNLKIFDVLGREIAVLVNEEQPAGIYNVKFNTNLELKNSLLTSGIYFYQLTSGRFSQTRKMILIK